MVKTDRDLQMELAWQQGHEVGFKEGIDFIIELLLYRELKERKYE